MSPQACLGQYVGNSPIDAVVVVACSLQIFMHEIDKKQKIYWLDDRANIHAASCPRLGLDTLC